MSRHSVLIQWSEEDEVFVAIAPELPGLSAFGSSQEEAAKELEIAKEAYLEVLQADGEEIPEPDILKPCSGQTRLRLPKSLHTSLVNEAKKEGVSLNTHIVALLSERNALTQVHRKISSLEDTVYKSILSTSPPVLAASSEGHPSILSQLVDSGAF